MQAISLLGVLANGRFQPSVQDEFFPQPFVTDVSLVPQGKWGEVANGGLQSLFWHELTPSNSLVLTWQNALYNRDANCPTNFQAELFDDGSFDYRYPDRTVSYAPVFPFDWDGDGLENSVDPEPLVAGPDAHGTNAEWYNTVCSNVFTAVNGDNGIALSPRHAGVNTNAYYFVDVVAERGPVPIYFTADGKSNLGNPIVVAHAGMTNHVPLLIGLEYAVTSSVPISVFCANENVCLTDSEHGVSVKWPVQFLFSSCGSLSYGVAVEPSWLGGTFSWTDGCCISSNTNVVSFTCGGTCPCSGCQAGGGYAYCGAVLPVAGGNCGCGGQGSGQSGAGGVIPDLTVSMCLDHDVILFEEAYTNRPGEVVARRSTFTRVQVAYGNSSGSPAAVMFSMSAGADRIILHEDSTNGTVVSEWTTNVVAGTSGSKTFFAEGVEKSELLQDVGLRTMISGAGGMGTVNRKITVSQITVEAVADFPTNRVRHIYGVAEVTDIKISPCPPDFDFQGTVGYGGTNQIVVTGSNLECPHRACEFSLYAVSGDAALPLNFKIFEPLADYRTEDVRYPSEEEWESNLGEPFTENDIGAAFHVGLFLMPDYVSFSRLCVQEGCVPGDDIVGFFRNSLFDGKLKHEYEEGAERELEINDYNGVPGGDSVLFRLDRAFAGLLTYGSFSLKIPVFWYVSGSSETNRLGIMTHKTEVWANGDVKVQKYDCSASRGTNNVTVIRRNDP